MKTFAKLQVLAVLGIGALAATAPSQAVDVADISVPEFAAANQEASERVRNDLRIHLEAAVKAPRAVRVRNAPSVSIIEESEMVLVVATRLPEREAIDPLVAAKVVRTAQVRF